MLPYVIIHLHILHLAAVNYISISPIRYTFIGQKNSFSH